MSRLMTGVLVAASLSCTCLSLVGCGQKGALYLPTTNSANASTVERRNANSHFIFGSSAKTNAVTTTPAATTPTSQRATGSAS